MTELLFVSALAAMIAIMLIWGFRHLPHERWQILASMPMKKNDAGQWIGQNLTFYGVLSANAYVIGMIVFIVLMGFTGLSLPGIVALMAGLLAICVPASRWVARIVEKKRHTFTVGGASFVGILAAPLLVWAVNASIGGWGHFSAHPLAFLSALSIAYAFGEGIGRLACISFGCCYGKPLDQCHPAIQKLFAKWHFVFSGDTKKIAYAHGFQGRKVVPIQAVTAILYCTVGLMGVILFLGGFPKSALFLTLVTTQVWRTLSEFFRADFRGEYRFSAYQIMGLLAVAYALILTMVLPAPPPPDGTVMKGLRHLWHPGVILLIQATWIAIFLYTGRSQVTGSHLRFHVMSDRV